MSEIVIQVDDLWKKYRLGVLGTGSLRHDFNRWCHRVLGKADPYAKVGETLKTEKLKAEIGKQGEAEKLKTKAANAEKLKTEKLKSIKACQNFSVSAFKNSVSSASNVSVSAFKDVSDLRDDEMWALREVSFEVKRGEILGIIGRNGAGKSTLLKILSRVTAPTSGEVRVKGRIASLLEVGTGFHPELTGRENIFLNGAILGMTKAEIKRKFDEIVDFSGVEQFLDTPVKRYSSGMYVRLAFAVAAHLEPEILIVDEVLAVGDAEFQKKCLGKMGEVAKGGRTVLFVSHNMPAVQSLTNRVAWLDGGTLKKEGVPADLIASYLQTGLAEGSEICWNNIQTAPGDDKARIQSVRVLGSDERPCSVLPIDLPVTVEVSYRVLTPGFKLNVSISLFSSSEAYVFASASMTDSDWFQKPHPNGLFISRCTIPANFLNQDRYYVTALLVEAGPRIIAQLDKVISFETSDTGRTRGEYFGYWGGVVRPILQWHTNHLPETTKPA